MSGSFRISSKRRLIRNGTGRRPFESPKRTIRCILSVLSRNIIKGMQLSVFASMAVSACSVGLAQVTGIQAGKASDDSSRAGDRLSVRTYAIDIIYADQYGPVQVHAATGIGSTRAHRGSDSGVQALTEDAVLRGGLGATYARPYGGVRVGGYAGVVFLSQIDDSFDEVISTAPSSGVILEAGIELSVPDLNSENEDRWADGGPMLRLTVARQSFETTVVNGSAKFDTLGVFASLAWFWHLGDDY